MRKRLKRTGAGLCHCCNMQAMERLLYTCPSLFHSLRWHWTTQGRSLRETHTGEKRWTSFRDKEMFSLYTSHSQERQSCKHILVRGARNRQFYQPGFRHPSSTSKWYTHRNQFDTAFKANPSPEARRLSARDIKGLESVNMQSVATERWRVGSISRKFSSLRHSEIITSNPVSLH